MRCLLALIAGLGSAALILAGALLMFFGGGDVYQQHKAYQVAFKQPGDGCGAERVEVEVDTGVPLYCGPILPPSPTPQTMPGFSAEQNAELWSLIGERAEGGLSETDQRAVQQLADRYAAEVPDKAAALRQGEWSGPRLFYPGLAMAATGAVAQVVMRRTAPW
jgi:hypothetical protein